MKKTAVITKVRNDDFYLRKWVSYYGGVFGRENLYIYFDGTDQTVGDFCSGCHTFLCEKNFTSVVKGDKERIHFLSDRAAELFAAGYNLVIGTDADEILVADPARYASLADYLERTPVGDSLSALGLDMGQRQGEEEAIREDRPFLSQRHYARLCTRYTKASILARPLRWGSGFHRVEGHNFHIGEDLYLFHLGYFDFDRVRSRSTDADRGRQGWGKHIDRRADVLRLVNQLPARDFDVWAPRARAIQTVVRPPYAWNKPAMFSWRIIVRIPDRFSALF